MERPKISAKEISKDIRTGFSNSQIRLKYGLSEKQLESIFKKLVSAGLFSEAELNARKQAKKPPPPESEKKTPKAPPPSPESDKASAVLADLKAGGHKMEIMSRHELSPSQYDKIVEELTAKGALPRQDMDAGQPARIVKCRFCDARIPGDQEQCPSCHQWLDGRDATPERIAERLQPPAIAGAGLVSDKYCPWDDRESLGLFNAYIQTTVKCLLNPASFFSELPLDKGYLNPLAFGVVAAWVGMFLLFVLGSIIKGGFGLFGLIIVVVIACVAIVPGVLIGLCLWGLVVHGCLLLVGGASSGLQATFRVVSYSACTQVFNAIPVVGNLVAQVYGAVLSVIGLKETHDTSTGKAAAAVLIPYGVIAAIALIAFIPAYLSSSGSAARDQAAMDYSGSELPQELCEAISTCISELENAATLGDKKSMEREMRKSLDRFARVAKKHSNDPKIRVVAQKISQFATATLLRAQSKDKTGSLPGAIADKFDPEKFREELMAMCGQ